MKLIERKPLHRCVDEVDEREQGSETGRPEVLASQPEDRHCAESDGDGLDYEEHHGARPQPPERREGGEDRVDVSTEPVDLIAAQVGDVERSPLRRRPNGLNHVPEVEPAGFEGSVLLAGERSEADGEHCHARPDRERDVTGA